MQAKEEFARAVHRNLFLLDRESRYGKTFRERRPKGFRHIGHVVELHRRRGPEVPEHLAASIRTGTHRLCERTQHLFGFLDGEVEQIDGRESGHFSTVLIEKWYVGESPFALSSRENPSAYPALCNATPSRKRRFELP